MNEEDRKLIEDLKKGVDNLVKELRRYSSLKAALVRGSVYGVGTAIGATVIAAVLLWLLFSLFRPFVEDLPFFNNQSIAPIKENVL